MLVLITISNVILIANLIRTTYSIGNSMQNKHFKQNDNSHLEVRAVIVKCDIRDGVDTTLDSVATRFQREELFKHNALRDCKQKLTLTVKATSEPYHASGDEYIPIDHVLGANKKRIRVLHPYVLRLRRKTPFQVYKLHRIDTVRGIIATPSEDKWMIRNDSKRSQRDTQPNGLENWSASFGSRSIFTLDHDNNKHSFSIKIRERGKSRKSKSKTELSTCAHTNVWHNKNDSLLNRKTRVRRKIKKYENSPNRWTAGERIHTNLNDDQKVYDEYEHFSQNNLHLQHKKVPPVKISEVKKKNSFSNIDHNTETMEANQKIKKQIVGNKIKNEEKNFALYEIGDPDLWYNAQIQLFEKLNTPEGKTVWNDLTKEDIASVSSFNPEWSNDDLNVQYKPINWLARDEFSLPNNSLCLVVPLKDDSNTPVFDKSGDFIIVPFEDIITVGDGKAIIKRDKKSDNLSEGSKEESEVEPRRRVVVRVTRALMGGSAGSLKIISRETEHYLKLPHTKLHQAQIDIEGRADDNELVLVGALGRLTTIVSDTTRKSRSILTVQTTNTGLAAARFRVLIRECTPELSDDEIEKSEKAFAGPELLPPSHTTTFRLTLPIENAIKNAHCVMALVNQDDESIAIRDVRIKRDDRCFCVWHCDCVCLSEDPKLLCRDLTEAQLVAAGLSTHVRSRHTRSVCYPDVVTINFFVTFIGVLLALLLLGVCKAVLGLILKCVGSCGLHLILQFPRKLDRYYESSLRCRSVVYDKDGWPVHPDSNQRSVRLVSVPVEFVLNVIFFITLPCLMIWEAIRKFALQFKAKEKKVNVCCRKSDTKKCFSSHDAQVPSSINVEDFLGTAQQELHFVDDIDLCFYDVPRCCPRRRGALLRWMTPQAEKLSTDIWTEGLTPAGTTTCDCPLLPTKTNCLNSDEDLVNSVFSDSDEEDTEYVLMQMQKSSESLAKCQQSKDEKLKTQVNKRNAAAMKKRKQ